MKGRLTKDGSVVMSIRISKDMLQLIEKRRREMEAAYKGVSVSAVDVIRWAVYTALGAEKEGKTC